MWRLGLLDNPGTGPAMNAADLFVISRRAQPAFAQQVALCCAQRQARCIARLVVLLKL